MRLDEIGMRYCVFAFLFREVVKPASRAIWLALLRKRWYHIKYDMVSAVPVGHYWRHFLSHTILTSMAAW